jgi:hypothetical protein
VLRGATIVSPPRLGQHHLLSAHLREAPEAVLGGAVRSGSAHEQEGHSAGAPSTSGEYGSGAAAPQKGPAALDTPDRMQ